VRALALPPGPLRILCAGAHSDDIEIGCGGTILRLLEEHPGSAITWLVLSATGPRGGEAAAGAARFTKRAATRRVEIQAFRDGFFPGAFTEIKECFEALKGELGESLDLIFTHARNDRHQDHRLVSDITWQTFRHHLILEYEIPKFDGDLTHPNLFVPIPEALRRHKVDGLLECFPSQRSRPWFTEDTFLALMRLRGVESGDPGGFAEAFQLRKAVLG
jgi:LmbE family N-acetylglucosaminyl deacetylase